LPAGARGGGGGGGGRDPVRLVVRPEGRRGESVRRVRVGPPGGQGGRGEARVLAAAGGGLFAGPGDGGGRDVQAVRPPALLGEPQHVPTLPAAEVDRVPGRELPGIGREGGVDFPGPDPRGIGVPLLPVIGGGHVRVAVLVVAVIVM